MNGLIKTKNKAWYVGAENGGITTYNILIINAT